MTIGYKKCRGHKIVKLKIIKKIDQKHKITNEDYAWYLCKEAKVLDIYCLDDHRRVTMRYRTARSIYDPEFIYKIGENVGYNRYGIHYFLSEYAAYQYNHKNYNGMSLKFYSNGSIRSDVNHVNGKRHGTKRYWRRNGKLQESFEYKNGILDGDYYSYHLRGFVRDKGGYKDGKLHGPFRSYDVNGRLRQFYNYRKGKKHGMYLNYDDRGRLKKKIKYHKGTLIKVIFERK